MIDVEALIVERVQTALDERSDLPSIVISTEYQRKPASFPHVFIEEMDNAADRQTRDSGGVRYANLTYEVNIYSNRLIGKKSECRTIADVVDKALHELNMTCVSLKPIPNMADETIYRMVGRYEVTVDHEGNLYARR